MNLYREVSITKLDLYELAVPWMTDGNRTPVRLSEIIGDRWVHELVATHHIAIHRQLVLDNLCESVSVFQLESVSEGHMHQKPS